MTFDYLVDDSDEMFKVAVILATVSSSATTGTVTAYIELIVYLSFGQENITKLLRMLIH